MHYIFPKDIPANSVLGVNYSGMHDTSIALVAPDGEPIFAVSLERISRVKQDGRPPLALLENLPWEKISKTAISVSKNLDYSAPYSSQVHPMPLHVPLSYNLDHSADFYNLIDKIPSDVVFVPHHISHAASAFWASGFGNALCLVYDGGMFNESCFGGLYNANSDAGVTQLDQFCSFQYANITRIYSAVTALLGFTPLKHEGKVTGLAAYGKPTERCRNVLSNWLINPDELDHLMVWKNMYDKSTPPELVVVKKKADYLRLATLPFSREEIAATVQEMAELHVIDILQKASLLGWRRDNICLAGGLFANVKINQRVAEFGFENIFVAPPMSDDGTALGAALHVVSKHCGVPPKPSCSMYLGPRYEPDDIRDYLDAHGIFYQTAGTPSQEIAGLLTNGAVVAIYQGSTEFGPRALGNRSILAQATESSINAILNEKLNRTEFMPFAPIVRMEDADEYFKLMHSVRQAAAFMTITVDCTDKMKSECPAVVHVDGTARPQLVTRETNSLIYDILSAYVNRTGNRALINTSFNVHEEPIVCSPEDALNGFFEAGLDYLYFDGVGLVNRANNTDVEVKYLRRKIDRQNKKNELSNTKCRTDEIVSFKSSYSRAENLIDGYLAEGFHQPELWGVWSTGRYSRILLPLQSFNTTLVELHISMIIKVFDGLLQCAPVLQITMNGKDVGFVFFRASAKNQQTVDFYVYVDRPICEIEFNLSNSGTPSILSQSTDQREIGFGLIGLKCNILPVMEDGEDVGKTNNKLMFWGLAGK